MHLVAIILIKNSNMMHTIINLNYKIKIMPKMNGSNELSLEQEFKLANYKKQLTKLDSKESKKIPNGYIEANDDKR